MEDFPLLLAGCQQPPPPSPCLPWDFLGPLTGERLGRFAPSHIPCFTTGHAQEGPRQWGWGKGGGTQRDAHTGKEGAEAGLPTEGPQGSHWGRALRMAFTSSATAVRANSNWSWRRAGERMVMERTDLCSCPVAGGEDCGEGGAFGQGSQGGHLGEGESSWGRWGQVGEAGCCQSPWVRLAAQVSAGRNSHLRADKARPLVTNVLQGGSDVNLLYSWRLERAQGLPRGQDPESLERPGLGGLEDWAEPGGVITGPSRSSQEPGCWDGSSGAGLRALWGRSSPFAMRFSTMSIRM